VRGASVASSLAPTVVEYSWAGLHVSHNGTDLISRGELDIRYSLAGASELGARCGAQNDV